MKAVTWTPERTAELIKRFQVDLQTQGEIGRAMGVTKNTIVGKIHRLGLKRVGKGVKVLAWTPERIADLKHRYETLGETVGTIARAWGVSKNTVCGKAHRMGLKRADVPIPKQASKPKRIPATRTWTKTQKRDRKAPGVRGLKRQRGEPKPLGEHPGGCQWLHGDATDRKFCGHKTKEASPYCAHHHDRCYVPAPKKKRRGEVIEP